MSDEWSSHPELGIYQAGHPTAQQIIEREHLPGRLTNTVILITGATSGLGVETARVLYYAGAHVFLAVRDLAKARAVKSCIACSGVEGRGEIDILHLDMTSLDSVRQCAADFLSKSRQLNVLICNAGVMASPNTRTGDGFETAFGVNHLAHFLLFQLLKDALLSSSTPKLNSRVATLSSAGHCFSPIVFDDLNMTLRAYNPYVAYGMSKTANVYMAMEIERRYGHRGLHATAVNPGATPTRLLRHLDMAILQAIVTDEWRRSMKSVEQGAATVAWAAVSKEWEGRGGRYLEDMREAQPMQLAPHPAGGYASHTYDIGAAEHLWTESLRLVGIVSSGDEE